MPKGSGELTAEFAVRGGRTVLVQRYHTSPLKIAKTFRVNNVRVGAGGDAGPSVDAAGDGVFESDKMAYAAAASAAGGQSAEVAPGAGRLTGAGIEGVPGAAVQSAAMALDTVRLTGEGVEGVPEAAVQSAAMALDARGGGFAGSSTGGGAAASDTGGAVRGEQVAVYVMDCSPGLMDGDRYELSWHLQPGAHVMLTNQSFTKVHPSRSGAGAAQRQTIRLARGAVLEYMPEPVMLYEDAVFRGETDVHLAQGSVFALADVLCPGRSGRGELFRYRRYANRLRVWHEEQLIYAQHQRIEPAAMQLAAPGCWERETHMGTLCVFAEPIGPQHAEAVLASLDGLGDSRVRYGASLTYRHGLVVSALGSSAWELQRALAAAWQTLRALLLGFMPLTIGK